MPITQLRTTSDEELIRLHDAESVHTTVGTQYFLDELNRRAAVQAAEATDRLAARTLVLTYVGVSLSVIATIAAVLALFLR
jgi:hypothetical protein